MGNSTIKKTSLLNRYKIPICMTFSFLLGCMFAFSIMPIDKTCNIEESDVKFNILGDRELKSPELIVLILSSPSNIGRRNVLRQTWLSLYPSNHQNVRDNKKFAVKHFFVIGHSNLKREKLEELEVEQSKFKDIMFVPMQDTYANLSMKVLKSFELLNKQYSSGLQFKYVMKCDDDSFVRLDNIIHELQHMELLYLKSELSSVQRMAAENNSPYLRINIQINSNETKNNLSLYWGYFDGRATMKRKGKWRDQNWISCDKYTPYALGGGYILSRRLVTYIAKNADHLRMFNAEDVSVGFWLSPVNDILRVHDIRFDTEWTSRGCQNFFLVSHNIPSEKMQEMITNIQTLKVLCSSPHLKRNFYHYNWSVPPSQCCQIK